MKWIVPLVMLLAVGDIMAESLPEPWKNWQYFRPLRLEDATEARLVQVTLPMEVFGHAQKTLADLRVIDQDGKETPYILSVRKTQIRRNWLDGRLTDVGFVPGEYTHVIVDTGSTETLHNRIQIDVEQRSFFAWVQVAVSEDRDNWRIVRERAPIYRFAAEQASSSTIAYPETRARWVRLHLLNEEELQIQRCRVAQEVVEEATFVDWPLTLSRRADTDSDRSDWEVDSGVERLPVSAVRFEAEPSEFHRPVRVSASRDGHEWEEVGQGDIFRIHSTEAGRNEAERFRSSLRVEFPEGRGRYWRVTILNRDDRPVEGLRPTLQANPYRVIFRQEPKKTYRLLYGNSRVRASKYDLRHLTSRTEIEGAPAVRPGEESLNDGYVSPEPWSERHPIVLWAALLAAVVVLGWVALRSLRREI